MLKLKLQYFGHLMRRTDSVEKTLMLGKIEGRRRRGQQRMRCRMASWLSGHDWVNSRSWWWIGKPGMLQPMGSQRVRHNWAMNWTELNKQRPGRSVLCKWLTSPLLCAPSHSAYPHCSPGVYFCLVSDLLGSSLRMPTPFLSRQVFLSLPYFHVKWTVLLCVLPYIALCL